LDSKQSFSAKHVWLVLLAAMMLIVVYSRDWALLDAGSPLRQRYAGIPWWMLVHGITGAVALFLAPFQFSSRLRRRYIQIHRIMGRVYVACTAVAAPAAIPIAVILGPAVLVPAATLQAIGWIVTTATALYCIRTGRIAEHREWMLRSYPFALVFVVVRVLLTIPPIDRMGEFGLVVSVWSTIAVAGIVPSFLIAWKHLAASAPAPAVQRAA
jgi:uncharacterized membrane protein